MNTESTAAGVKASFFRICNEVLGPRLNDASQDMPNGADKGLAKKEYNDAKRRLLDEYQKLELSKEHVFPHDSLFPAIPEGVSTETVAQRKLIAGKIRELSPVYLELEAHHRKHPGTKALDQNGAAINFEGEMTQEQRMAHEKEREQYCKDLRTRLENGDLGGAIQFQQQGYHNLRASSSDSKEETDAEKRAEAVSHHSFAKSIENMQIFWAGGDFWTRTRNIEIFSIEADPATKLKAILSRFSGRTTIADVKRMLASMELRVPDGLRPSSGKITAADERTVFWADAIVAGSE